MVCRVEKLSSKMFRVCLQGEGESEGIRISNINKKMKMRECQHRSIFFQWCFWVMILLVLPSESYAANISKRMAVSKKASKAREKSKGRKIRVEEKKLFELKSEIGSAFYQDVAYELALQLSLQPIDKTFIGLKISWGMLDLDSNDFGETLDLQSIYVHTVEFNEYKSVLTYYPIKNLYLELGFGLSSYATETDLFFKTGGSAIGLYGSRLAYEAYSFSAGVGYTIPLTKNFFVGIKGGIKKSWLRSDGTSEVIRSDLSDPNYQRRMEMLRFDPTVSEIQSSLYDPLFLNLAINLGFRI